MNIVIAIDSFKGSLTSEEASQAICEGIKKAGVNARINTYPLADGGEGTTTALVTGLKGKYESVTVTGPLGEPIDCSYGVLPDQTVVMEMASCAGLPLVPIKQRNPLYTTTYGVGEMIKDAINKGYRHFMIGIGGSSTNDGGVGMLQALGFDFLDIHGRPIPRGAIGLSKLASIKVEQALPMLSECSFRIACDVTNPLYGQSGCSHVFSPQKGANPSMILEMDEWLQSYSQLTKKVLPESNPFLKGAGAAGGMGFAFASFLNAQLVSGVQLVLEVTHLEEAIRQADLVITGEGKLDGQTIMGKGPIGVSQLAKKYNKKVIAFAGCVTQEAKLCHEYGINAFFPIIREALPLETLLSPTIAQMQLSATAEEVFRLLKLPIIF